MRQQPTAEFKWWLFLPGSYHDGPSLSEDRWNKEHIETRTSTRRGWSLLHKTWMSTLDSQTLVEYKSGLTPKSKNLRCGPQVNTYNSRMGLFETQHHMGLSENSVPQNPLMFFSSIPHFQRHPSMTQHLHQISSNIIKYLKYHQIKYHQISSTLIESLYKYPHLCWWNSHRWCFWDSADWAGRSLCNPCASWVESIAPES